MANYTATIGRFGGGVKDTTRRISFSAPGAVDAIALAELQAEKERRYYESHGSVRYAFVTKIALTTKSDRPGLDPMEPCDDCYRPLFEGHNWNVEH